MASRNDSRPVVIKRKKVVAKHGHHGGAWKVAYADFVTAMMAFFLMLWLLGSTTEDQRKGLADYFSPTVTVLRTPAGGDGLLRGDAPGADSREAGDPADNPPAGSAESVSVQLEVIEAFLHSAAGDNEIRREALQQMITRISDQGLVIEIHDLDTSPLFLPGSETPSAVLAVLSELIAEAFAMVTNPIVIDAHVRAQAVVEREIRSWELSTGRALTMRRLLDRPDVDTLRFRRITGHGDRAPVAGNPVAARNNRIELTLLRSG